MKRETLVWTIVLAVAAGVLLVNAVKRGAGNAYVRDTVVEYANVGGAEQPLWVDVRSDAALDHDLSAVPAGQRISWVRSDRAEAADYWGARAADPSQKAVHPSFWRTLGVWAAALFTLFILSFLYRDNPFYKFAEAVVVGVSAAYWMVVGFWTTIVPNLFGKLAPDWVKSWAMPGLEETANYWYLAPLVLGIMLLMRLSPKGGWISRWPLAFIIGATAGYRLVGFLHADFLSQISNSIVSLVVEDAAGTGFDLWASVKNVVLVAGVFCSLVYFFFSVEHKGFVGKTARAGIWTLMITFGAAFGYTVMGRIALLAIRIEFLFDDWLWLIDPAGRHTLETARAIWAPAATALGLA